MIAAHELRTPLTSLLGYVQMLKRDLRRSYSLEVREERVLRTIVAQTIRLKKLIGGVVS